MTSPSSRTKHAHLAVFIGFFSLSLVFSSAANEQLSYQKPPKIIEDLVSRPPIPSVLVDPINKNMLLLKYPALPPISFLSQPELRLAGFRINPVTNGPSRDYYLEEIRILNIKSGKQRRVSGLPQNAKLGFPSWSPDASRFAFTLTERSGVSLWVVDLKSAQARRLTTACLNTITGFDFVWLSNSRELLVTLVPKGRGAAPRKPTVPSGPVVRQTTNSKAPARTYQDLLKTPHDKALFDYYFKANLARVDLNGNTKQLSQPAIFAKIAPSPDGRYILVKTIRRPYSYTVPMLRFARKIEIWNRQGKPIRTIADLPKAEQVPIRFGSVPTGPRLCQWRQDVPATLVWIEALDGGDANRKASLRDRVSMLKAPFRNKPLSLIDLALRYDHIHWGTDDIALVTSRWWQDRRTRTWIIRPGARRVKPSLLWERSFEDRYNDPGSPVVHHTKRGTTILTLLNHQRDILLTGAGASADGDQPFLDRLRLPTRETKRLWRSKQPYYEYVVAVLDQGQQVITRRESRQDVPNFFLRDLEKTAQRQLTDFVNPSPELSGVTQELIRYQRQDDVALNATLYLPAHYDKTKQGRLPMLLWAYPMEYKSVQAASQVRHSPYRFISVSWKSPLLFLTQGYAVLDEPTMCIIGEGDKEPNDTYVEQLVSSARAAVEAVAERGVVDRDRIAIGGHSYGAFMAANLLAHSDLFRAGIARSGAYNRTLTPFGFQTEQRTLWQATATYINMSPFLHANKINEPLLLIHGDSDNNAGTYPLQSRRMFHALKGLGKTARLVILPKESHGYRAYESVMHMLFEMHTWLEKYVKNPKNTNR